MGALKKLNGLAESLLGIAVNLIEEGIEAFDSRESRADLHARIRKASDRGAELALRVAQLEDEIDHMRFNGPTLWKDEVEVLATVMNARQPHPQSEDTDEWIRGTISKLLNRCDHMPMTANEMARQIEGIADGSIKTVPWDDVFNDPGKDVDCKHSGWDFNYGSCPDCGQEGCGDVTT